MNYKEQYEAWLNNEYFDEATREELMAIREDEEEIEDRFYRNLEFGTAGLRGKVGAGTNRMNKYIIRQATQGLADFIVAKGQEYMGRGVAIAYDVRHFSREFAKEAALVLAGNGIKAYLFEDIRPTPELSYTVRRLQAAGGIVVTASHNPREYNGYKVYWEEGAQILSDIAVAVEKNIESIKDFSKIKMIDEQTALKQGLLNILGQEIDDEYLGKVESLALRDDINKEIKLVYTPLNGTGNIPVRRVLKERGFKNVWVVPEQEKPDPDFSTVGYPNPEDTKAFAYAEKLGKSMDAEMVFATDPDCDRVACMVKGKNGDYVPLNGNQTGAILIEYILSSLREKGKLTGNGYIVKSIVTGDLGKAIAQSYGIETFETLTGFKNICGKVNEMEKKCDHPFLFGYEESIGYVAGTFVRDKDGVIASMLLCEAAAYYSFQGKSLLDVLEELYHTHGYHMEKLISLTLEGMEGQQRIGRMMKEYRKNFPMQMGDNDLMQYIDYEKGIRFDVVNQKETSGSIPVSDVLRYFFEDGSWYAVRPSGTEPKIKIYIYTKGRSREEAQKKITVFEKTIMGLLNDVE
ncbi:phosphoglucomutase [Anaerosolibacter carboniphilus]|uniref:Phosphoglucomutase n=1 Tax=Anaerosolibacter carboniphilus TaxID=1417629 RepID=A0A841KRC0_9FIRM|nr:phospho-sugar mutase [Anaerosolibacter carboniphilus]MBB6216294.1 phosphoglucomutase [Anaerosolibacter carboniphilus]